MEHGLFSRHDTFGVNEDSDIIVVGSEKSGKSCLILHYVHNRYIPGYDSEGDDTHTKQIRNGGSYNEITIMDCSSTLDFYSSSRKRHLMNNSAIVFTYAINDLDSFHALDELYDRISDIRPQMPPVVVAGLKSDLEHDRIVSYDQGRHFSQAIGAVKFVEASSLEGVSIDAVFKPLVDIIIHTKTSRRRLSQMRHPDVPSMQSLKEVLSDTPATGHTYARSDSSLTDVRSPGQEYDDIDISIPKFKSNTFMSFDSSALNVGEVAPKPASEPNSPKKVFTETSQRKLQKNGQPSIKSNSKAESHCCVIV